MSQPSDDPRAAAPSPLHGHAWRHIVQLPPHTSARSPSERTGRLLLVCGSPVFNVLAHCDYSRRYWPTDRVGAYEDTDFEEEYRAVFGTLPPSGRALEINTERDEIEFPYFNEFGKPTGQEPFAFGQGLTSRIISQREPLLLNRESDWDALGTRGVGTASKSFLGVPILAGDRGDRGDQRPEHEREGRFSEADARLLSTIAANVGVAIQNARLFQEAHRRADEMSALAEVGQEISATLDAEPS